MQGSSVVIDHICQIWENRIFKKNWKIYILRVLEFRENSKTDISSDQKEYQYIPYMIILQCILLEAGEGLDLSKN